MSARRNKTLCLLIHGYLGTPFEMESLLAPLEGLGLDTRMITLPGHASTVEEFKKTYYRDWLAHAVHEYELAAAEYSYVIVIGFSLGGALALRLAELYSPKAVITLAAPVLPPPGWPQQMRDWALMFLPLIRLFKKELALRPWKPEAKKIAPWQGYEGVAHPPQLYSMFRGFKKTRKDLAKIDCPALVMHDLRDRVVTSINALAIASGISSAQHELAFTKMRENITTHHMLTTHQETKGVVAETICSFIARFCA